MRPKQPTPCWMVDGGTNGIGGVGLPGDSVRWTISDQWNWAATIATTNCQKSKRDVEPHQRQLIPPDVLLIRGVGQNESCFQTFKPFKAENSFEKLMWWMELTPPISAECCPELCVLSKHSCLSQYCCKKNATIGQAQKTPFLHQSGDMYV